MKEVSLYKKLGNTKVQCHVCSHFCKIDKGNRGVCGVRENISGILCALNYGRTIAVNIDPIEKKPLFHFMPGTFTYSFATVGCNFRCDWCQNWEISQCSKPKNAILGQNISPKEHVEKAIRNHCPSISYTYTEPTIFLEYAYDTMKLAKKKGLKNIWVSNGYMSSETLELITPYLDAINVDFKGSDDSVYQRYCGGKAKPVINNLKKIFAKKIHLEITTLVVPGVNDKEGDFKKIAIFIAKKLLPEIPWHISRFFPSWKMLDNIPTSVKTLKKAEAVGKKAGLKNIYIGNI